MIHLLNFIFKFLKLNVFLLFFLIVLNSNILLDLIKILLLVDFLIILLIRNHFFEFFKLLIEFLNYLIASFIGNLWNLVLFWKINSACSKYNQCKNQQKNVILYRFERTANFWFLELFLIEIITNVIIFIMITLLKSEIEKFIASIRIFFKLLKRYIVWWVRLLWLWVQIMDFKKSFLKYLIF